jgi:lysophospholipase L1-like esterase
MLGDSLTELGRWSELLGLSVLNRGIGGDTSATLLRRLPEVLKRRPKVAFLLIGFNDVRTGVPLETTKANLRHIVNEFKFAEVPLVILSTVFASSRFSSFNHQIAALNVFERELCIERGIPYLDLNSTLAPEGALEGRFTADGYHLTDSAYREWAALLRRQPLSQALKAE